MEDLAVILYRKRREERLAARGYKIKKNQYRKAQDGKKMDETETKHIYHNDAQEDEQDNGQHGGGGHGNTRLPFGLCQRYGIDIGEDWSPRDAWDALAGKGITPESAYKSLRAGEEITPDNTPETPKDPVKTIDKGGKYYVKDLSARRGWSSRGTAPWELEGTPVWKDDVPEGERKGYFGGWVARFATKTDLYLYLKEKGVEEFADPETGEIVNPAEMELPKPVYTDGEQGFSAITIGLKKNEYVITGTDFDGRKKTLREFWSLDSAQSWLTEKGVDMEDIKLSPALKKREEDRTRWLTSDKKEYIESDGDRYGDLMIEKPDKPYYWSDQIYVVRGQNEKGDYFMKEFDSEKDALCFLRNQGVERVRNADKEYINPQEIDIPKPVAVVNDRYCKRIWIDVLGDDGSEGGVLYGEDLDGNEFPIDYLRRETYNAFLEKMEEKYGITDEMIEKSDTVKDRIAKRMESEKEKDERRKHFAEKAIPFGGRMFSDVKIFRMSPEMDAFSIYGYDEDGDERRIELATGMGEIIDKYLTDPEILSKVDMDVDTKKAYEDMLKRRDEFDNSSEKFGEHRYLDIELLKEDEGQYRLYGYDRDGNYRRLTYSGGFYDVLEEMKRNGIEDPSKYIKMEDVKSDYDEYRKRVADFEKDAIDVGGTKYSDVVAKTSMAGYYTLAGSNVKGEMKTILGVDSMHELVTAAKQLGIEDIRPYFKYEDDRKVYDDYMEIQKRFATEAEDFGREKYIDLEIDYDPSKEKYRLYGTNIRGERSVPVEMVTEPNFRQMVESLGGKKLEDYKCSDRMKDRLQKVKKASDAIASGEYYDMGVDGHAFKNIFAEKTDTKWSIKGTDESGKIRSIKTVKEWDEAITAMESYGVKDYKMLTKDRTYERPTDGMRHVVLAKDNNGTYRIYADSDTRGTHAEVYTAQTEEEARKWLSDNNVDSAGLRTHGMNPNDNVPRTHTQRALDNFDTHRVRAISGSIIDDMNEAEKNEAADMLKTLFTHGAYRCARSTKSFGAIIDDRYKSQVETGTAGFSASKNTALRKRCSNKMYGHGGMEDRDYEKCGYLGASDDDYDYNEAGVPHYGGASDCVYTFRKDKMVDRASYTFGDSLNTYSAGNLKCAGYAGENPTLEGLTALGSVDGIQRALKEYRRYKKGEISFNEMFRAIKWNLNNGYIEMQFNGDVTVEDIEKVTFRSEKNLKDAFDNMDSDMRKRVIQKLRSNNVQLMYRKRRDNPFIDAWTYIKVNYIDDYYT